MSVTLVSNDGVSFTIDREVIIAFSVTIKDMLSETGADTIPLDVNSRTLEKIITWANYHQANPYPVLSDADKYRTDNVSDWDKTFMEIDMDLLFDLVIKANYLDMRNLLELGCKTIANMIKGLTPDEVKTKFRLPGVEGTGASAAVVV